MRPRREESWRLKDFWVGESGFPLGFLKGVIIPSHADAALVLPLAIPDLQEVKAFARHLHAIGKYWQGELFGWPAEYTPERRKKPADSKMLFTPADFWIGESGIWFFSLMWEHGKKQEPVEFLDDRGIVRAQA
jgi:hypothetical protein